MLTKSSLSWRQFKVVRMVLAFASVDDEAVYDGVSPMRTFESMSVKQFPDGIVAFIMLCISSLVITASAKELPRLRWDCP